MGSYTDLRTVSAAASITEIVSGMLMASGFLGPIGPALIVSVTIVAAVTVHWGHGLLAGTNGVEVPLLYSAAAFALALTGYGQYSLDSALRIAGRWPTSITWIVLAVGIIGGFANVALRRRPAAAGT